MRALCYSDVQATDGTERCFNDPSLPLQRYRVQKLYKKLYEIYQEYSCDCLWDFGDTTDDRTAIPIPTVDCLLTGLEQFPYNALNIKLIGNHEQFLRNTELHAGKLFSHKFNVVHDVQVFEIESVTVIAAAYPKTTTQLVDTLTQLFAKYRRKPIILLGHFTVTGCKLRSGIALGGVPKEILDSPALSLLGDVHLPQQITEKALYIGSPFQQNFGESNEDKRVIVVDINGSDIQYESIPLPDFPKYRSVSLKDFKRLVTLESEDRFEVTLKTSEQAKEFYQHPLSSRARSNYQYTTEKRQIVTTKALSLEESLDLYLKEVPPETKGFDVNASDIKWFGKELIK